jgi:predicted O-methyltransferase YrrM
MTIQKVIHTFGFMELLRLIVRKLRFSNKSDSGLGSIGLENIMTFDKVLESLTRYDQLFKHVDIEELRSEFDTIFNRTVDTNRESFFSSNYDLGEQLAFLSYSLIRIIKPKLVIETGVAAGISSTLILSALSKNNYGTLNSFDITSKVGELIPNELKSLWTLKVLNGLNLRDKLRKEIAEVKDDFIFLHDSDHALKWQEFEISLCISTGKCRFFLIDDVSPELVRFLKKRFIHNNLFLFQEVGKISAFTYF